MGDGRVGLHWSHVSTQGRQHRMKERSLLDEQSGSVGLCPGSDYKYDTGKSS